MSLTRKPLMPMARAAVSSSRMATQARPMREWSARRKIDHDDDREEEHQQVVVGEAAEVEAEDGVVLAEVEAEDLQVGDVGDAVGAVGDVGPGGAVEVVHG